MVLRAFFLISKIYCFSIRFFLGFKMQKRSLVSMFFLGLVTFGIYYLYWFFATRRELIAKGAKIPSAWLAIIPFFNIYFLYKYCEAFYKYVSKKNSPITYLLLLLLLPVIGQLILQHIINEK
jgi:hypothetical protein